MSNHSFVVSVTNNGYSTFVELKNLDVVLSDEDKSNHWQIRIIDESGED